MAKFKPLNENQLVMLPISLQDQLVPDTLEHTISELVDKHIDLSVFNGRYNNDDTGATAIHPKILLKVILLAYARGMISSRQTPALAYGASVERACQENIIFIALSYGYAPDHSTIASFISSMQSEVQTLFSNILLVCEELELLEGTHFSLDGVKLSANVSKEWSGSIKELQHKHDKLQEKLQRVIAEHKQADKQPEGVVVRQQKRERRFQLKMERLNLFLKDREPKRGSDGKEIQSNAVDNESVKMPSSHAVVQGIQRSGAGRFQTSGHSRRRSFRQPGSRKPQADAGWREKEPACHWKRAHLFRGQRTVCRQQLSLAQQFDGLQR